MQLMRKRVVGFTLLEVVISLAVVSILTMVALPSYSTYIDRSRRGDAMDLLLEVAAAQQSYYLSNGTYASNITNLPIDRISSGGHYRASIESATPTKFVLSASPDHGLTSKAQAGDGKFELSSTGLERWDCNNDGSYSCTWSDAVRK